MYPWILNNNAIGRYSTPCFARISFTFIFHRDSEANSTGTNGDRRLFANMSISITAIDQESGVAIDNGGSHDYF